jgi:hypothetical protein
MPVEMSHLGRKAAQVWIMPVRSLIYHCDN